MLSEAPCTHCCCIHAGGYDWQRKQLAAELENSGAGFRLVFYRVFGVVMH